MIFDDKATAAIRLRPGVTTRAVLVFKTVTCYMLHVLPKVSAPTIVNLGAVRCSIYIL